MSYQACKPVLPVEISISAPQISCLEATKLVETTQHALDDRNEFPVHHLRLRLDNCLLPDAGDSEVRSTQSQKKGGGIIDLDQNEPALRIELEPKRERLEREFEWRPTTSKVLILYDSNDVHSISAPSSALASYLATSLHSAFVEEQATVAHKFTSYSIEAGGAEMFLKSITPDAMAAITRRDTRSFRYASTYHLTFSLFTPGPAPSSWAVKAAIQDHIEPLVSAFSGISNFSITTQVQLFSPFSPAIQAVKEGQNGGTVLRRDDLGAFVNAAEWPLSPSIGSGPTINFVLYVPLASQTPLTMDGDGGDSWLVPQWGGIKILNPPLETHPETGVRSVRGHLSEGLLHEAFETFTLQLLSLLGVPSAHSEDKPPLPLPVRLQSHVRLSALSVSLRASSTLGALARLSQALSSIPIPKSVAHLVDETINHLTATCRHLQAGSWNDALLHAREAFADSERAFFEKSMVGQVYFPDEHKVAVYLPLLGPVGVPLFVGLLREIRGFVTSLRAASK